MVGADQCGHNIPNMLMPQVAYQYDKLYQTGERGRAATQTTKQNTQGS